MTGSKSRFKSPTTPVIYQKYRKGHPEIWTKLSRTVGLNKHSIAVDVGCGPGVEAKAFGRSGAGLYVGVDRAYDSIEVARQSLLGYGNLNFICGDAVGLPFKNESIDFVSFMISLHQMKYNESVLIESCRILKKTGSIAVVDVPPQQWLNAAEFRFFPDLIEKESKRRGNFTEKDIFDFTSKYLTDVEVTWMPYLIRQVDMQVVEAVQNKYFSALSLISDAAFQKGLEDLTKYVEKTGGLEKEEICCFILTGGKRK